MRQFKFACPVCGQHLQARAQEAGQTIECPSCFKKLTVPQAPTEGGGKLIITAALADTRRAPQSEKIETAPRPPLKKSSRSLAFYVLVGAAIGVCLLLLVKVVGSLFGSNGPAKPQLWTDSVDKLRLLDTPAVGRLNGWDFTLTSAVWRDTTLILKQQGSEPEALRLELTFPLKAGELVPHKTFRLGPDDPPFDTPPEIVWKDQQGAEQEISFPSGYILRVEFDEVSRATVSGRIHICLPDVAKSWLVGRFSAKNKTRVK